MIAVVYACWGAFAVVWAGGYLYNLVSAPRGSTRRDSFGATALFWSARAVLLVAVVVIGRRAGLLGSIALQEADQPALAALGAGLLIVATAFTLWSRVQLGTMWSSTPMIRQGYELRTEGPYRITRHPIYTGMLGMFIGTLILTLSPLVLVAFVLFTIYIATKIRREEQLLTETFGDQYRAYRRSVPAVLPFFRSR